MYCQTIDVSIQNLFSGNSNKQNVCSLTVVNNYRYKLVSNNYCNNCFENNYYNFFILICIQLNFTYLCKNLEIGSFYFYITFLLLKVFDLYFLMMSNYIIFQKKIVCSSTTL